ncbi:hypothetical protein F4679DRAFT_599278 [Xylaria curta]|nr:hypothetical protein F4679DRAFT_599278 [Xylaria curta]
MPSTRKGGALPQVGGQELTSTAIENPPKAGPSFLDVGVRRSSRVRERNVDKNPESSTKTRSVPKLDDSLRTRNVIINAPLADEWTSEFKKFLVEEPIEIPLEKTQDLQTCVKYFLERADRAEHGEDSYDAIEELRDNINKWTETVRLAAVTNQEFKNDLEQCKAPSNATVFQQTVMMSIIDRSHLDYAFDFNCGGQWSLQGNHPLPSTGDPGTRSQVLDLIWQYSSRLTLYLEGNCITKQCLQDCIPAAFFKDVRLFSFAIDTQQIIARVYRAVPVTVGTHTGLEFYFDELNANSQFNYTRDSICTLIQNILIDYAESKILGVLKAADEKVLEEHIKDLKRQNEAAIPLTKEVDVRLSGV